MGQMTQPCKITFRENSDPKDQASIPACSAQQGEQKSE